MLAMSAILEYPQKHPISAEEYLRMGEAGVFAPEARLELIEGEIIEMAPIHPPQPGAAGYGTSLTLKPGQSVACVAVPEAVVDVEEVFSA